MLKVKQLTPRPSPDCVRLKAYPKPPNIADTEVVNDTAAAEAVQTGAARGCLATPWPYITSNSGAEVTILDRNKPKFNQLRGLRSELL